jgi:hypothetical protein
VHLRATTAARRCTNIFFPAFQTFYRDVINALADAVRFHPGGEESRANIQRKSRSRTRMACSRTRHPLVAGGKYFSRFSTNRAGAPTASRYIVAGLTGQGQSAPSRSRIFPQLLKFPKTNHTQMACMFPGSDRNLRNPNRGCALKKGTMRSRAFGGVPCWNGVPNWC